MQGDLSPQPSPSRILLTDLYQLTMAYGYWKQGMQDHEAVFHLTYRSNPFRGGYAIACGLEAAVQFMEAFHFEPDDLAYLASLTGNDGRPLFEAGFIRYLQAMEPACSLHAVPEGTAVFPHLPLLRIEGPLIQCQLLETPLLNLINFQTLIATKASRVTAAAAGDTVLEFGLRRAQGEDGGLSASRAAYIGGCHATSNVLAGKRFGIPVRGTHAHSWVMSFGSEPEAFEAYAAAMPNNCVFLVDTYDTLQGVRHAISAGLRLRAQGHRLGGIRLDSGDLAALSKAARALLDEAGFPDAAIVASNDLDEYEILKLKAGGACIGVWGVGTRLATAYDQPALGGVYKLGAIRAPGGAWAYKIKLSEQPIKVSNPGIQQVRRYRGAAGFAADLIFDSGQPAFPDEMTTLQGHPASLRALGHEELLVPVFEQGKRVYALPGIHDIRQRAQEQLAALPPACRRFDAPDVYPVGHSPQLAALKAELMDAARRREG
jgi:nicotinate phosphoribosyltransferase